MQRTHYATVILQALTQATSRDNTGSQGYEKAGLGKLVNNGNKKQCPQQSREIRVPFTGGSEI